ncbi:MAG: hexose transporter hxt1 [Chrysothrix sp. TS-e1954]|nr:MAG: hexose transporter hxt1 [Chrysothrix sp. TS-e1954]
MNKLNGLVPRSKRKDATGTTSPSSSEAEKYGHDDGQPFHLRIFRLRIIAMVLIVSLGGLIFGYDTGQISGFVAMNNFLNTFADEQMNGKPAFSNSREGTIVGLLSIGTLMGAIGAAPVADRLGRKLAIVVMDVIFCVGVIVQIATTTEWYQIAIGRWVAGLGVGALSVLTPMYQAETAPKQIRGALICCYQLFITFGIFLAYCINYGTENMTSRASWRIPMGIGFIFPVIMAVGIMFLRESTRWDYRNGHIERALTTISKSYGVPEDHPEVRRELREIKEKFEAESAGGRKHPWYEVVTGPRMAYRTLLGMTLQALQQLTGANFFFYYGTSIFESVGINNSFVTSMILGGVNFGSTFFGLYVVENFGRRKSLIAGGFWMFMCFMVFASVGHFLLNAGKEAKTAGTVMIVFACLFIVGYAITWGPIIWALVGEIYPSRYRAKAMGIATSANWTFNFLISFFTPYITSSIDYRYGYVFAACNFAGALVVYFFVAESQGRTLEEIDTMYVLEIKPWKSSGWKPPRDMGGLTDEAYLTPGARGIDKRDEAQGVGAETREDSVVH